MYYGSFFFKYTHVLYINATYCRQYVIYIYVYIYIHISHVYGYNSSWWPSPFRFSHSRPEWRNQIVH